MPEPGGNGEFTVLFAGGGTGGHLTPGLSVAQELQRRYPECRAVFAGTSRPIERRIVEQHGFNFFALPSVKFEGSALATPSWALRLTRGLLSAWRFLPQVRPDLVVSLGCYAALPPAISAALRNVPLVVMEQNATPGKANRLLSWWAREVYVPWPGTEMSFAHPERVHVTGNPVRADFLDKRHCRKLAQRFGLSPRKRTLLVLGGSQGARAVNRAIMDSVKRFQCEAPWLQVLHSAGETDCDTVRAAYKQQRIEAAVFPYIEDMASAYSLCDLAVCRAGGTTLAELTALGVPAVLVPHPFAAHDHQRRNASFVAGGGGAIIADEADLSNGKLGEILLDLLGNEPCLRRMRQASIRIGRPAAARNVADRLFALLQEQWMNQGLELTATGVRR